MSECGIPSSELLCKWMREQESLKQRLILEDDFTWTIASPQGLLDGEGKEAGGKLRYVGGVDLSFSKSEDNPSVACGALVVVDLEGLTVVYSDFSIVQLDVPYIPGFLAFREGPVLRKLLERMKEHAYTFYPQVLLVDGNGLLHPRGFGLACHLGITTNLPTIGIGKTLHHLDGLTQSGVRQFLEERENCTKDVVTLVGNSGCIWGTAMRSTEGSVKPIFVSIGHRISLSTAIKVVKLCCKYRIPEPIRQADIRSKAYLQSLSGIQNQLNK